MSAATEDELLAQLLALPRQSRRRLLGSVEAAPTAPPPGPRTRAAGRFPASASQEGQWILWRMAPRSAAYHVPLCYELSGPLRPALLRSALEAVVARHEVLRTTFADGPDGVEQVVRRDLTPELRLNTADSKEAALAAVAEVVAAPFDLRAGSPLRAALWRIAEERHILLVVVHHIAMDERSSRVLEAELTAFYRAALVQRPAALPPLALQCGEHAQQQRAADRSAGLRYWVDALAGAESVPLPDRSRPGPPAVRTSWTAGVVEVALPDAGRALAALAAGHSVSAFTALAAVFAAFLAVETGASDVVFGTPMNCRSAATENLIGYFMNTVVLRSRLPAGTTVRTAVAGMRATVAAAIRHQDVSFQAVVDALRPTPDPERNPLYDTMLVYLSGEQVPPETELAPGLFMQSVDLLAPHAHRYVLFSLVDGPAGATLAVQYASERYAEHTVRSWAERLGRLLSLAGADPGAVLVAAPDPGERP